VHRGGIDRFTLAEEQQQAFIGQVRADIAIHAAIAVTFGEAQQIVDVNKCKPGSMNQPVRLREFQICEANRRIREASSARAQ
jgi:hypothetical protein